MQIDLKELRLTYGKTNALDGLTVTIPDGGITGLLGRNGSGKTSLLSILAGFRKQSSGEVTINGEPVFENATITRDIALIRGSGDTVEDSEKVSEALRFAAWLRPNWDEAYAGDLLDAFEVASSSKIKSLSRGKRSALGIALGLATRAPLTMFDETYLGLDAPSRLRFYDEILKDYMAHPRTFIISTHLIEEVSRIFERVVMIDKGRLLIEDEMDDVLRRGVAMTGPADHVDAVTAGLTVIGTRQLGRTKSTIYGELDTSVRIQAVEAGIEFNPVSLQDLFVHLTDSKGDQ